MMRPIFSPNLNWSSVIGLFLLNFAALEIVLLELLKSRMKAEAWNALKKESFHDRVLRLRRLGTEKPAQAIEDGLMKRLEAVRDLRNHLAHSTLVNTFSEDLKSCEQRLVMIKDYVFNEDGGREVSMEELLKRNKDLADLVGELSVLT